jgi:hypothetical protein
MNRSFHGRLEKVADAKGGASLAAQSSLLKRRAAWWETLRPVIQLQVPLSTKAVDKSVDFWVFQGANSAKNCIFITMANY